MPKSICLVRPEIEQSLLVVGSCGIPGGGVQSFTVSLEDWNNPLVTAFTNRKESFFPAPHSAADAKRRPSTPFEDAPFHAVPLGVSGFSEDAFGLLLVAGSQSLDTDFHWFVDGLQPAIDQILRQQALTEGDRKQGRERSLLYSIINAVTDPILLTDTEGRLLIANARALTLFTASEEESEGRRGAVRMNNMLLSSALSSKAIEETGAARRELLLVTRSMGPTSCSSCSAPSPKIRGRAAASSRFFATSPTCAGPARRSKRTTARCGSRKHRRAPKAIV